MTNIVIYARYSSEKQTEQSIEGQLRVCHEFAERNNYNIVNEYIDRAMTGTNDHRPAFQQMIEDSIKKEFEFVLVYKLDRFSRSKYDNAIYKHKLQQNGVKVISATESISNTPEGALMEGLLEMFAEMYIKDLSEKVKRGMRESILKGNFIGGRTLFGYSVINKKVVVNEEQAKVVKKVFSDYANGKSKQEIKKELNKLNIKTNSNSQFSLQSLQNMLSNEKYVGIYKSKLADNDNYYPPIISLEVFKKVQERLRFNKRHSRNKENYLLRGKVYCGICGNIMVGTSGTSKTQAKHCYYACSQKNKFHNCTKKNEKKQDLESKVIDFILKRILEPKTIDYLADQVLKAYEQSLSSDAIKQYEKKIAEIEKEFDKITNQIVKSTNENIIIRLNKQADDLTNEQKVYKNELAKLKLANSIKHTKKDIIDYLNIFIKNSSDSTDAHYQKLIDLFVNAIYVFDDHIHIYFNLFQKQDKIDFDEVKDNEFSCLTEKVTNKIITRTLTIKFVFYKNIFGAIVKK